MLAAKAPGRIVVIGDSDFLRDDFVRGEYQQIGGPASLYGALFFGVMLDWLSQDSDLMSLYAHQPIDRNSNCSRWIQARSRIRATARSACVARPT